MKREITLAIQINFWYETPKINYFSLCTDLTIHHNFKFIKVATPDQISNEWGYLQYKVHFPLKLQAIIAEKQRDHQYYFNTI